MLIKKRDNGFKHNYLKFLKDTSYFQANFLGTLTNKASYRLEKYWKVVKTLKYKIYKNLPKIKFSKLNAEK